MNTFGDRLAQERKKIGLNQTQLSEIAGVQRSAQTNYEVGKRSPDVLYLEKISALGIDVCYLLTGQRAERMLDSQEAAVLTAWRGANMGARNAALLALIGGTAHGQVNHQNGAVNIGSVQVNA